MNIHYFFNEADENNYDNETKIVSDIDGDTLNQAFNECLSVRVLEGYDIASGYKGFKRVDKDSSGVELRNHSFK